MEDEDFNTVSFSSDITDIPPGTRPRPVTSWGRPRTRTARGPTLPSQGLPWTPMVNHILCWGYLVNHILSQKSTTHVNRRPCLSMVTPLSRPSPSPLQTVYFHSTKNKGTRHATESRKFILAILDQPVVEFSNLVILDQLFSISSHVMSTNYCRLGKLDFLNNS